MPHQGFFESLTENITEREFDAVVEGCYPEDWSDYYKILKLELPKKSHYKGIWRSLAYLEDHDFKYELFGYTDGYEIIERIDRVNGDLKAEIDSISDWDGLVYSTEGLLVTSENGSDGEEPVQELDKPRSIILDDGRIYLNRSMLSNNAYIRHLAGFTPESSRILKSAKMLFDDEEVGVKFREEILE